MGILRRPTDDRPEDSTASRDLGSSGKGPRNPLEDLLDRLRIQTNILRVKGLMVWEKLKERRLHYFVPVIGLALVGLVILSLSGGKGNRVKSRASAARQRIQVSDSQDSRPLIQDDAPAAQQARHSNTAPTRLDPPAVADAPAAPPEIPPVATRPSAPKGKVGKSTVNKTTGNKAAVAKKKTPEKATKTAAKKTTTRGVASKAKTTGKTSKAKKK